MKIIRERETGTTISYEHEFLWHDSTGSGFGFECDENGNLSQDINPAAKANYEKCVNGTFNVIDKGIVKHTRPYKIDAIGLCECGHEVYLSSFTNTCGNCFADYNSFGQRLADRSQWGEETGESLSDIFNGAIE
jgi:hypothetical protein